MGLAVRLGYAANLLWQIAWHTLLPRPMGSQLPWLALIALLPLLMPLKGVMQLRPRSMTWASYLLLLYFAVGVTLACFCVTVMAMFTHRQAQA